MSRLLSKIKNLTWTLLVLLVAPLVLLLLSVRQKKLKGARVKILVVPQLTRIGDLVCSTPVFREIKQKYPTVHLTVLISRKVVGIVKNNPRIDELIIYEDYSFWWLVRKVWREKYDWSFSLVGVSTISLLTFLGLVKNRVKTVRVDRPKSEILTDWMSNYHLEYRNHTYLPQHYTNLLQYIGIHNTTDEKEVFTTHATEQKVKNFCTQHAIVESDILIGISITAGNKIKEWGDEKFLHLAQSLKDFYPVKISFIGGAADRVRIMRLLNGMREDVFIPATLFSIEELPSFMKRLALFIAVDTGPIYIAHALKIPLIDIIGPVDPKEQPPNDELSVQVLPPLPILPSSFVFKRAGSSEDHKRAIESISVSKVLDAVQSLLEKKYGLVSRKKP